MRKKTTTRQLNSAITNNLLKIQKAELYHKDSGKTDIITDSFAENLAFLCESGCFVDCIRWSYKKDYKTNSYIVETGRINPDAENIVIVHLCATDDVSDEDLERALKVEETEDSV